MEPQNLYNPFAIKKEVPNAQSVLIMGILSLVFMFCCGLVGLVLAIIAVVQGTQGRKAYQAAKDEYSLESYNKLNAGYIMGWIAIGLNILSTIILIIAYATGKLK